MREFRPGIEFNAAFYDEVVGPVLRPWRHSAALLGWGSEILGFDTARSTDHGWGPRLQVFVESTDVDGARTALDAQLPSEFRGWPVRYGWDEVVVEHRVRVDDLGSWLVQHLGHDPRTGISPLDWLVSPQQLLLGVVRGEVYHDGLDQLHRLRAELHWYPDDLWRWIVACQWQRIAQEEAFVGRAASVGDDLGSRVLTARQVRELMRLWFLFSREYWPYGKWFGSAFSRLPGGPELGRLLAGVLDAPDPSIRERALADAYEAVALGHNAAIVTDPVDPTVREFYGRGHLVLMSGRFVDACIAEVTDPWLRSLPLVGSVDQVADSTDLLSVARRASHLRSLYEGERFPDIHGEPEG